MHLIENKLPLLLNSQKIKNNLTKILTNDDDRSHTFSNSIISNDAQPTYKVQVLSKYGKNQQSINQKKLYSLGVDKRGGNVYDMLDSNESSSDDMSNQGTNQVSFNLKSILKQDVNGKKRDLEEFKATSTVTLGYITKGEDDSSSEEVSKTSIVKDNRM